MSGYKDIYMYVYNYIVSEVYKPSEAALYMYSVHVYS